VIEAVGDQNLVAVLEDAARDYPDKVGFAGHVRRRSFPGKILSLALDSNWRHVTFHYFGHVPGCYTGIPDVVRVDEDDGTFLVTTGADVTEHGGLRYAAQLHLFLEHVEQFAAPLRAAASLARGGANEDLAQLPHA
jgi:hypothetical protein